MGLTGCQAGTAVRRSISLISLSVIFTEQQRQQGSACLSPALHIGICRQSLTLSGSATPGHHGLDGSIAFALRSSFDATGSVRARRRRRRTPRECSTIGRIVE